MTTSCPSVKVGDNAQRPCSDLKNFYSVHSLNNIYILWFPWQAGRSCVFRIMRWVSLSPSDSLFATFNLVSKLHVVQLPSFLFLSPCSDTLFASFSFLQTDWHRTQNITTLSHLRRIDSLAELQCSVKNILSMRASRLAR